MHLAKLTICGFRGFAESQELEFAQPTKADIAPLGPGLHIMPMPEVTADIG